MTLGPLTSWPRRLVPVEGCGCAVCDHLRLLNAGGSVGLERAPAADAVAPAPAEPGPSPRWADQVMNDLRMARAEEHAIDDAQRALRLQLAELAERDKVNRGRQSKLYSEIDELLERDGKA